MQMFLLGALLTASVSIMSASPRFPHSSLVPVRTPARMPAPECDDPCGAEKCDAEKCDDWRGAEKCWAEKRDPSRGAENLCVLAELPKLKRSAPARCSARSNKAEPRKFPVIPEPL